jgi:hypothetical protein
MTDTPSECSYWRITAASVPANICFLRRIAVAALSTKMGEIGYVRAGAGDVFVLEIGLRKPH